MEHSSKHEVLRVQLYFLGNYGDERNVDKPGRQKAVSKKNIKMHRRIRQSGLA